MKKVLYLTFYFEPDLCAGSFRNTPLAQELAFRLKDTAEIHVVTTLPNRYSTFVTECKEHETFDNLRITRIKLPAHKSGFTDQVNSFRAYYFQTLKVIKHNRYDLVIASSSRLFTAFLGYRIASKQNAPLYLDIRDIFTDTLEDVLQNKLMKAVMLPFLRNIEKRVCEYAQHINLISPGFDTYFKKYKIKNLSYFTNGIDEEFVLSETDPAAVIQNNGRYVIAYAGNIGEGQGLHKIIPKMAVAVGEKYRFRIIGDGGAAALLKEELRKAQVTNVQIEKPMRRTDIIEVYKNAHFIFIHLNDYAAFKKVLPSKVFEAGAFPRPIIAGVSGFARQFLEEHVENCLLFDPADSEQIVGKLNAYNYKCVYRMEFIRKFSRKTINGQMVSSMILYLDC